MTIKIWNQGNCIRTIRGHTESIRGVTDIPNIGILSYGLDCDIRLWSYEGDELQILSGHSSAVFKVTLLGTGELVSVSDDGSAKLWKRGFECVETIRHGCGIWDVAVFPNDDFVTVTQDGVARVWTRNPDRHAPAEIRATFESEVLTNTFQLEERLKKESSQGDNMVGQLDVSSLPTIEALKIDGTKDGQMQPIQVDGVPYLFVWKSSTRKWEPYGRIVSGPTDDGSEVLSSLPQEETQWLDGEEFDYVFDVQVSDGKQYKFGYNVGESVWEVADKYIGKYKLKDYWKHDIAQFLLKNTLGKPPKRGVVVKKRKVYRHFPITTAVLFSQGNSTKIFEKILSFSKELANDKATEQLSLNLEQEKILKVLCGTKLITLHSTLTESDARVLRKLMTWPPSFTFPALDLLRLSFLYFECARMFANSKSIDEILMIGTNPHSNKANPTLMWRALANFYAHNSIWLEKNLHPIDPELLISTIIDHFDDATEPTKLAISVILSNFFILFQGLPEVPGIVEQAIQFLTGQLEDESVSEEIKLRLFMVLGSLITGNDQSRKLAKELDILLIIQPFLACNSEILKQIAEDIKDVYDSSN
eukprot:TRINITY_DN3746_c0_g1_i24.p1 TRINITY_DN3746_c0_g1~~TRINITY_DN3746_c0_g1_i24.p1  ORF type:complete len:589 (-),score=136.01 TRINITY_DN3746_c0_g1_i24:144-1910(-)